MTQRWSVCLAYRRSHVLSSASLAADDVPLPEILDQGSDSGSCVFTITASKTKTDLEMSLAMWEVAILGNAICILGKLPVLNIQLIMSKIVCVL